MLWLVVCGAFAFLMTTYWPLTAVQLKELLGVFVTFGVTLGGFLLTILAVLAGFSGTPFMRRLFQAELTLTNIIEVYLFGVAINLLMAVAAVAGISTIPDPNRAPDWFPWVGKVSVFLFVSSIYFTVVCIWLLRLILKGIMKAK